MDFLKKTVRRFTKNNGAPDYSGIPEHTKDLINRIKDKKLTYLSDSKLIAISKTIYEIENKSVPGIFIEAGCALGGSSILIASLKKQNRILNIYDVFGTIPPPSENDTSDVHKRYKKIAAGKAKGIDGNKYYGYMDDLQRIVMDNLLEFGMEPHDHNIYLIKGLIQDTMKLEDPVAFAHIDVDWYEPVYYSLSNIYPRLSVEGSIILDDYHDWGGCKKATDQFLSTIENSYQMDDSAGSMTITKIKS